MNIDKNNDSTSRQQAHYYEHQYLHQYHDSSSQHSYHTYQQQQRQRQTTSIDEQIGNLDSCISELANVGGILASTNYPTQAPKQQKAHYPSNIYSNPNSNSNQEPHINASDALISPTDSNKKVKKVAHASNSKKTKKPSSDVNKNDASPDLSQNTSSVISNKRRKKDPQAPKAPLNGYLVYFNEERVSMRQKNPQMSFGDLTKEIANRWKELPQTDKQKFINEAEADKERYLKEMEEYKQSDGYKQYVKENQAAKQARAHEAQTHINQQNALNYHKYNTHGTNGWSQHSSDATASMPGASASYDNIPIFTEDFMTHNKNRDQLERDLRKEVNKLTQQNSMLTQHLDTIKQSMNKVEQDLEQHKMNSQNLQKILDVFRQTMLKCFSGTPLPNTHDYPNPSNIDEYVFKLFNMLNNTANCYSLPDQQRQQFVSNIKSIFSKFDFSTSFVDC